MTATITAQIKGVEGVVSGLGRRELSVLAALRVAVKKSAIGLTGYIKEKKLSGQVLNVRSGRLRRSIIPKVENTETEFSAVIGPNRAFAGTILKYAPVHEYGFKGTVTVKGHRRLMKVAFGRRLRPARKVDVRAHSARRNIPERPFMRPSVVENTGVITGNIQEALKEALK